MKKEIRFEALADFFSEEVQSQYVQGMKYTLRAGNKKLALLLPKWIDEGKVKIVAEPAPGARVGGKGEISDRETVVVTAADVGRVKAIDLVGKAGKPK